MRDDPRLCQHVMPISIPSDSSDFIGFTDSDDGEDVTSYEPVYTDDYTCLLYENATHGLLAFKYVGATAPIWLPSVGMQ